MDALPEIVREAAEARPEKAALIFHGRVTSYGELDALVDRTAAALGEMGIGGGDRVAILLGNIPEFVYGMLGILRLGAVAVPLNPMYTPDEVAATLANAQAAAVIAGIDRVPSILERRDEVPTLEHVLVVGPPPTPPGTRSFDEAIDAAGPPPEVDVGRNDLALLQYTAGTTAHPKGAMLTHGNLLANLEQVSAVPALKEAESDVVLLVLPLFHIYALNAAMNVVLMEGATAVLEDGFDPVETLKLIEQHDVTILFGVPQMFQAWLAAADAAGADLSSVRLAVSGAAPLPAEVLEAFAARFGCTIWEGYGLTETAPVVTTNALGEVAKGDSIGLPLPGVEVRLLDEDGTDVIDGDQGEILVRGPNVFKGYWREPEDTDRSFHEGWLRTGDIAYRDEDGYLFLVDRSKDLIIVSGFNVFPREVEEALATHPAVRGAAVIGVPDERTGEAIKAFVVADGPVTEGELRDHCAEHLARFKLPREIELVDSIPRHATGKVVRRKLRE